MRMRIERDSLGPVRVPDQAYYGAQTARAVANFPISGVRQHLELIHAYATVKKAAATANMRIHALDRRRGQAIVRAADEVVRGRHDREFVVDVFQAGAGTSTNMNLNEVIANRAEELLGGKKGRYRLVHPNDHVNRSQSTNDTYHATVHVASRLETEKLLRALRLLQRTLEAKAREFKSVVKIGRTHLQDALPITLGQEFSGYAAALGKGIRVVAQMNDLLLELPLGGTAIGTGVNAPKGYAQAVVRETCRLTGQRFRVARNYFSCHQSPNAEAELSGALRAVAIELGKIVDDLILLSSGPNAGLREIILPAVQPGSSIMPGKVNPGIAEMVNMVSFRVLGNDLAVSQAAAAGQLELNVYTPVISYNLLESIKLLTHASLVFEEKCLRGVQVNYLRIRSYLERNPIIATALTPRIGYERAAQAVRISYEKGLPVRDVVVQKGWLSRREADQLLRDAEPR